MCSPRPSDARAPHERREPDVELDDVDMTEGLGGRSSDCAAAARVHAAVDVDVDAIGPAVP